VVCASTFVPTLAPRAAFRAIPQSSGPATIKQSAPSVAPAESYRTSPVKSATQKSVAKKPPPSVAFAHPVASRRFVIESRELTRLARALKNESESDKEKDPGPAYDRLARFAKLHEKEELGERAALALGYSDYNDGRYNHARQWLDIAKPEKLLPDYILFWSAQVDRNLNNNAAALAELQELRSDYPHSVLTPLALQALAETAIALNQAQTALDALASAKNIDLHPTLLFLRAQAHEQAGDEISAAADYLGIYDHYPLSAEADEAGAKVAYLQTKLGAAFPEPPPSDKLLRANILFEAHQWQQAKDAYTNALPALTGDDRDVAQLRMADCQLQLGGEPSLLSSLQFQNPDTDAQRLYYLAQAYRSMDDETGMLGALAQAQARAPQSDWTERTLFAAGNYYWVNLHRNKAAAEYAEIAQKFPASDDAINAEWRVAWAAYMDGARDAADLMGQFLAAHPDSIYTPDALYWLGRLAQKAKNAPVARAYFRKLEQRFPNNYFALHAPVRLRELRWGRVAKLPVLAEIPPLPPKRIALRSTPAEALPYVRRSIALETIAFDDAAMLELQAAYDKTHAASLEFSLARAAVNGQEYGSAIAAIGSVYPSIASRPYAAAPREAWLLSFPLPYRAQILAAARRTGTDPMILAGLIHQESAFERDAHSYANAYGLMQLIPGTAQRYARELRVSYSEERLLDPLYNLRLGSVYFGKLMRMFHTPEAALAAYNAGEDRVTLWEGGQKYSELPEFVESIPFTQTREYVEIVMRNAAIYRHLYGIW